MGKMWYYIIDKELCRYDSEAAAEKERLEAEERQEAERVRQQEEMKDR